MKSTKVSLSVNSPSKRAQSKILSPRWHAMESHTSATAALTVIVDTDIEKLSEVAHLFSDDWSTVSIGQEISAILVGRNEAEYSAVINEWIDDRFRKSPSALFLCYDIDLLFYPTLKLDPLAIFRQISRHRKLIVLWPGSYDESILCYAQPEHSHYHCWKNLEGIEIKGAEDAL